MKLEVKRDFSTWTFTYTEDYQLIAEGQNELTAKKSCTSSESDLDFNTFPGSSTRTTPASGAPLNEWHTVNGTGVIGAPPVSVTSASEGTKGADGDDEANVIGGARPGTDAGGGEVDYGDVADGERRGHRRRCQ